MRTSGWSALLCLWQAVLGVARWSQLDSACGSDLATEAVVVCSQLGVWAPAAALQARSDAAQEPSRVSRRGVVTRPSAEHLETNLPRSRLLWIVSETAARRLPGEPFRFPCPARWGFCFCNILRSGGDLSLRDPAVGGHGPGRTSGDGELSPCSQHTVTLSKVLSSVCLSPCSSLLWRWDSLVLSLSPGVHVPLFQHGVP